MLCGERDGRGEEGKENTKEKARDEKRGDGGDSDKGDGEGREMELKSDDIKGRRDILWLWFWAIVSQAEAAGRIWLYGSGGVL